VSHKRQVLITGVSRGLGRAMAKEFAAAGHRVFGCGRSATELEALSAELGPEHRVRILDVADDDQVAVWARELLGEEIVPDLLINNAAVINANSELWKVSAGEFDHLMAVNVSGTANIIRHFVPAMIRRRTGTIVNFSSGWGRSVAAKVSPYCASKWAIEGLTMALAEELPNGMCAVPLNPGIIDTEMLRSCFGTGASGFPGPDEWARRAVPFILQLNVAHNGQQVSVPE
jgi:NAD(P)-dependent dehydrogenase (short-subunit alcohol dehydrogenase family)